MIYVIKFMFYVIVAIAITVPVAGVVAWSWSGKKTDFKDWIKTF